MVEIKTNRFDLSNFFMYSSAFCQWFLFPMNQIKDSQKMFTFIPVGELMPWMLKITRSRCRLWKILL